MTRTHFEAFAEAIGNITDYWQREAMAILVANVCAKFSTRFDRERFLQACHVVTPPG